MPHYSARNNGQAGHEIGPRCGGGLFIRCPALPFVLFRAEYAHSKFARLTLDPGKYRPTRIQPQPAIPRGIMAWSVGRNGVLASAEMGKREQAGPGIHYSARNKALDGQCAAKIVQDGKALTGCGTAQKAQIIPRGIMAGNVWIHGQLLRAARAKRPMSERHGE